MANPTYADLINGIRSIADHIEARVIDSQLVSLSDEVSGDDDTLIFELEDAVNELLSNVTGVYR